MHELIAWSGFVGAWLLVAGPLFQAALELGEEQFERSEIEAVSAAVTEPPPISPWWWLLPPVAYAKQWRRRRDFRGAVMQAFTRDQLQRMVRFTDKATSWTFVAVGAFFIATKETWELREVYEWPVGIFWALLVVMLAAAAAYTGIRMRRSHAFLARTGE